MSISVKTTLKDYSKQVMQGVREGNEKAILYMCQAITTKAKDLAPRKTGQLINSIQYRTTLQTAGSTGGETELNVNPQKGIGYVGATAKHAIYQEFGTQKQAPQPFIRPAINAITKGTATQKTIGKIVNEYASKQVPKK